MKIIVCPKYGSPDVLELREVPMPSPRPGEVLVKIHAAGLNAADWRIVRADPFLMRFFIGLLKPNIKGLGGDMAGVVESLGPETGKFKPGDEVFADISNNKFGGCAEYVCVPEKDLALKPKKMSFEEAASLPLAGGTALIGLQEIGKVGPGDQVLIHGASGGVGIFALQIAKILGAEVTAVCSSSKMAQARELGADHVIDYAKEDFTQNRKLYDVILGVNGYQHLRRCRDSLKPGGRHVLIGGSGKQMIEAIFQGPFLAKDGKTLKLLVATPAAHRLVTLAKWVDEGKFRTVIDRRYPLAETAEAIRYLEKGHAAGKVVIQVAG